MFDENVVAMGELGPRCFYLLVKMGDRLSYRLVIEEMVLPKFLLEQFSRFANAFFLLVCVLQVSAPWP